MRFLRAHPRYCAFASSSRSAETRSARAIGLDLIDVVAMEHDVQGQREFERCDPLHDFELPVEGG